MTDRDTPSPTGPAARPAPLRIDRLHTVSALGRAPGRIARPPAPALPPEDDRPPWQRIKAWLRDACVENLGLKFVSMILAATVFILVNTDREREIVARVGVSYTLPEDKVLVSERVDEVRITVKGPWRRIKRFDEREVDRIQIDLTRVQGGEVPITPDMINLSQGLRLTSITPRVVRVAFEKREVKEVDVTPTLVGRPMHGFVVTETRPYPQRVVVRGPEGLVHALPAVRTQEIRIDGRSETFEASIQLVPPEGIEVEPPGPISVTVQIDEQLVTRRVGPVPLKLSPVDDVRLRASPSEVMLILTGGLRSVERAVAELHAAPRSLPGEAGRPRTAPVVVEGLPPGVGVQVVPPQVPLVIKR